MAVLSKFLTEIVITPGINDRLRIENSGTQSFEVTLAGGSYRDIFELLEEFDDQCNSSVTGQTFTSSCNSTGYITVTSSAAFGINFDTASYGTSLRDTMGFNLSYIPSGATRLAFYTSNSAHADGYYPSEPVESDTRPLETGTDMYDFDTYQTESRTGRVATKGGTQKVYDRSVGVLLPYYELEDFSNFVSLVSDGRTIAFYHDRTEDWPGPSNEYKEYVYFNASEPISYRPEAVDGGNRVWYRQEIPMRQYVE